MRIERMSDEQIKFVLNKDDLNHYNLKISDLVQRNARMYEFIHELMTQAMIEHDFSMDQNTPLLVDTIPQSNESIIIIITKTNHHGYTERPRPREERRYRRKPFIEPPMAPERRDAPVLIYMFKTLNEVGAVAARLKGSFRGVNSVYKKHSKYYLVLHNENNQNKMEHFEAVLMEYGQRYSSSVIYKMHLDEYGEVVVRNQAIDVLADIY